MTGQEIIDMMFSNEKAGIMQPGDRQIFKIFDSAFEIIREHLPEKDNELAEAVENIIGEISRLNFEYGAVYGLQFASGMGQVLFNTDRTFSLYKKENKPIEEFLEEEIKIIKKYRK